MKKPSIGDILYRATVAGHRFIRYDAYVVEKLTPSGMWLERTSGFSEKTWRCFRTHFASSTQEEAMQHLLRRKRSHVAHAERRYEDACADLHLVERELGILPKDESVRLLPDESWVMDR